MRLGLRRKSSFFIGQRPPCRGPIMRIDCDFAKIQKQGETAMFFDEPRTDGLLRGSRSERKKLMVGLADAPWDLETFLGLHLGLLDHSEEVRAAAMNALQGIAKRKPAPLALTPAALLAHFMHSFTVASGVGLACFWCLAELDTAESLGIVKAVLESGQGSNDQFEAWVDILRDADQLEILRHVKLDTLSKTRRKIIDRVLAAESGHTGG